MLKHVLNVFKAMGGITTTNWVRLIKVMLRSFAEIQAKQGPEGLVKFLKVCSVCVQQSLGGHRQGDLTSLGPRISRTKGGGLPRVIPAAFRRRIRNGDTLVIKLCLTLFSMYRDIIIPGKLKLNSIIAARTTSLQEENRLATFIEVFTVSFAGRKRMNPLTTLSTPDPFIINRSSPNSISDSTCDHYEVSTDPSSIMRSWWAWVLHYPMLLKKLHSYAALHPYSSDWYHIISILKRSYRYDGPSSKARYIGKLGIKEEAAGKVRVFAMVDPLTQWVMRPLHDYLFKILKKIAMDGTFNQEQPLGNIPEGCPLYSFDLSSATDRLPLSLQKRLVSELFGDSFGSLWASLLVERDYYFYNKKYPFPTRELRYSVGQPMGALSSWAMLAYTHHFIVQAAAWTVGRPQNEVFRSYAVLGDDIVIWDKQVADSYLRIITRLGVEVGLAKSILSPLGLALEFAKRTIYKGVNVSPIPFKEYESAISYSASWLEFSRKYSIPYLTQCRILGVGYRSRMHNRITKLLNILSSVPQSPSQFKELMKVTYTWSKDIKHDMVSLRRQIPYIFSLLSFLRVAMREEYVRLNRSYYSSIATLAGRRIIRTQGTAPGMDLFYSSIDSILLGSGKTDLMNIDQLRIILKTTLYVIDDLYGFLKEQRPYWDLAPYMSVRSDDRFKTLLTGISSYFNTLQKIEEIQLPRKLLPKFEPSISPQKRESQKNIRIWKKWLALFNNNPDYSHLSRDFISPIFLMLRIVFDTIRASVRNFRIARRTRHIPVPRNIVTRFGFGSFLTFILGESLFVLFLNILGYTVLGLLTIVLMQVSEGASWSTILLSLSDFISPYPRMLVSAYDWAFPHKSSVWLLWDHVHYLLYVSYFSISYTLIFICHHWDHVTAAASAVSALDTSWLRYFAFLYAIWDYYFLMSLKEFIIAFSSGCRHWHLLDNLASTRVADTFMWLFSNLYQMSHDLILQHFYGISYETVHEIEVINEGTSTHVENIILTEVIMTDNGGPSLLGKIIISSAISICALGVGVYAQDSFLSLVGMR